MPNENEFETIDSINDEEETVNTEEENTEKEVELEEVVEDEDGESKEDLLKKIKTLEAQKNHWRTKATKPTMETKQETTETTASNNLSTKDLYALMENKVAEEDIDEVLEYAQLKKVSVAEALKSSVVKTLLKEKNEMRQVAAATNTGAVRRSAAKVSDEDMVRNANNNDLPNDPVALAKARFQLKLKK